MGNRKQAVLASVIGALMSFALAAAAQQDELLDSPLRYQNCLELVDISPNEAFEMAQSWRTQGGGIPARHCAALALIALEIYDEGAVRLEQLAEDLRPDPPDVEAAIALADGMRADLLSQAGNAWLLASNPDNAYAAFSQALGYLSEDDPERVETLIDRARALADTEDYGAAINDLDRAAALAPERGDIYVFRASAWRAREDIVRAREDIERAAGLVPDDPAFLLERGMIRRLDDDRAGARADWQRLVDEFPETPEAELAEQNLALLTDREPPPATHR